MGKKDNLDEALGIVDIEYPNENCSKPPEIPDWSSFGKLVPLNKREGVELHTLHDLIVQYVRQRQHVAAIGRRVSTLCKGEDGLRQQLGLYHVY